MGRPVDFQLVRDGDRDLTFNGFVLAEAESMDGPAPTRHSRAAIYQTLAGRIVAEFAIPGAAKSRVTPSPLLLPRSHGSISHMPGVLPNFAPK